MFIQRFLAGSIETGKAERWQKRAEEYFSDNEVVLYNPRLDVCGCSSDIYNK